MQHAAPPAEGGFDPGSRDDLAELLDSLPPMVGFVDGDGYNRYVNAAVARWLRRPADRVVGRHLRDLLGAEGYRVAETQLEAATRGETQEFVRAFLTSDGRVTQALTTYLPRIRDGRPDGFFVLTTDVTARVRAESEHLEATVRSAELEQRNSEAAAVSDDALQQLYAIGLHLDRLQRHPEALQQEVGPVLVTLQETITGLRASITGLLLAGQASSTQGVVARLVAAWASRTGTDLVVVVDVGVDDLGPDLTRDLLTALSQILATAARHGAGPIRVRVVTDSAGHVRVEAEGDDWPHGARADFDRMATMSRDEGGRWEVDVTHPVVTRVGWERREST